MKKLRVTVNEKVYEVQVEILEDDEGRYPGYTLAAAPVTHPVAPPAVPAAAPAPPPTRPAAPSGSAGGKAVVAPIVGTVTKILATPGAAVRQNQPLIILDAMKMDTYINSPRDGVVAAVECAVGDSVQVGQRLVSFQ